MRRVIFLFLITLMTLSFTPTVFATISIETLTNQQSLDIAKEKSEVQQAINTLDPKTFIIDKKEELELNELDNINSSTELEYGEAYKVFIANKTVIQTLIDGKNLSKVLPNAPYHWEFPITVKESMKPIASFTVAFVDNKWQVAEIGGYLSPEQSVFSSKPNDLNLLFNNLPLDEANSYFHFRISSLHADFLYLEDADEEYFIPLIHSRDELYGLKNKTIYTRDEIVSALGPKIEENLNSSNPAPTGNPNIKKIKANYIFYAFSFIVIVFLGYKKLSKQSNI
ncbi:MAG: hypothetical protein PHX14_08990 [Syntrophomonadaceae bacterium]|nr:hypothetical protein [Syntrophomonadaceae bacterium]